MTSSETVLNGNSVKTKLYSTPLLYFIVLASSVKILDIEAIEAEYHDMSIVYQSKKTHGMKILNLLLTYVVCGCHLEFMLKNIMFKVKINVRNVIHMPELLKIDL